MFENRSYGTFDGLGAIGKDGDGAKAADVIQSIADAVRGEKRDTWGLCKPIAIQNVVLYIAGGVLAYKLIEMLVKRR